MAEMKQLSLRESARFDYNSGQGHPATKWSKICAERHKSGVSRSANIRNGAGKSGKRTSDSVWAQRQAERMK